MKKVLVLGSSSFTGHYICERLASQFELVKCTRSGDDADFRFDAIKDDFLLLEEYISVSKFDCVVNCFSNGNVDSCEENPDESKAINYQFVKNLVDIQKKYNFHLVHFSTNAVYSGENAPYSENSPANAVNKYGEIKLLADKYIEDNLSDFTILRPITMYGIKLDNQRHNPFSYFYDQIVQNKTINAVDDVYTNMLHVEDLIKCVKVVIEKDIYGKFNISGDDVVNRYEFVSLIKEFVPSSESKINQVTSDQFKTIAKRPRDTSFNNAAMKSVLGVNPKDIREVLKNLVHERQASDNSELLCA